MHALRPGMLAMLMLAAAGLAAPAPAQESGITIEAAIARDVVDRLPVDTGSVFAADVDLLWCWMRVTGAEPGTTLEHVWSYGEHEWVVPLTIGGSPWRTYSRKRILAEWVGEWTVAIRDADGNVLETLTFTIG